VAWEAANHFLVQGEVKRALEEFRVVMEGAPNQVYPSLQLCLHLASVHTILAEALPHTPLAYLTLVDLLTSQKDTAGAQTTWDALVQLRQPVDTGRALQYISYLIAQHEVGRARTAWNETIQLNGLSSYLTGHDNLIVNPSFDADILNGGFDWQYRHRANVELAIDPSDFRAGRRSLAVSFDGPGISDAGIFQLIPVEPDTTYDFSAYFKSDNMDGAGGPRLALEDAYTSTSYLQSDDLKNSDVWRQVSGEFKTQPDTQLLVLRLMRVPQDSPIRGKLWIDNFQLSEKQP
jgi:carbohydrate binding protein with CBM4/9 domain